MARQIFVDLSEASLVVGHFHDDDVFSDFENVPSVQAVSVLAMGAHDELIGARAVGRRPHRDRLLRPDLAHGRRQQLRMVAIDRTQTVRSVNVSAFDVVNHFLSRSLTGGRLDPVFRVRLRRGGRARGREKPRPDFVGIDADEGRNGQIRAGMALAQRPVHAFRLEADASAERRERRAAFPDGRNNVGSMPAIFGR